MKRKLFIMLVIFLMFFSFVNAGEKQIRKITISATDMALMAKFSIEVKDVGDRIYITIFNPAMISIEKKIKPAVRIKFTSNIVRTTSKRNLYLVNRLVKGGKISFTLSNHARSIEKPVIEHIQGDAESADGDVGFFFPNKNNKWITCKTDLGEVVMDSLTISFVMYPDNKPTVSLKSLSKSK